MNYSGAALLKPEGGEFASVRPLAHQTLSGGTPDSPVRQTRVLFGFFCSFLLNPNLIFYWFVLNLYAPVEYII
jgi:hypothetical protein